MSLDGAEQSIRNLWTYKISDTLSIILEKQLL